MNVNHQSFITEYLRHRSPFTAYCLAYNLKDCSNYDSIMSSANRLMNNEEVGGTIRSILDNIRHEVEQEVRAEMKQEVLTVQRKRELLASIATGEMVAIQNYKGKDCNVCTQMVRPTINQMLRSIDLDNKMVGLYPFHNRQLPKDNISQQITTTAQPSMRPKKIIMNEINNKNSPPYEGGDDCNPRQPDYNRGEVDSLRTDNPEKNTPIGNKTQQSDLQPQNIHHEQPTPNSSQEGNKKENHNNSQQSAQTDTPNTHTPLLSLISPRRG